MTDAMIRKTRQLLERGLALEQEISMAHAQYLAARAGGDASSANDWAMRHRLLVQRSLILKQQYEETILEEAERTEHAFAQSLNEPACTQTVCVGYETLARLFTERTVRLGDVHVILADDLNNDWRATMLRLADLIVTRPTTDAEQSA